MELEDLKPYFELYNNLRGRRPGYHSSFRSHKKKKEYAGKELHFEGIVSEIDLEKNELIVTCHIGGMQDSLHNITSNHFLFLQVQQRCRNC